MPSQQCLIIFLCVSGHRERFQTSYRGHKKPPMSLGITKHAIYQNQVHVNIIIFFNVFQTVLHDEQAVLHDEQAGLRMEAIETEVVGP